MDLEEQEFPFARIVPARQSSRQAARYLGFQLHDIPILVADKFLHPLGHPQPSAVKYFATIELDRLKADRKWLSQATDTIYRHWQTRKARRAANLQPTDKAA